MTLFSNMHLRQLVMFGGLMCVATASSAGAVNYTCPTYSHTDSAIVAPYNHPVVVGTGDYSAGVSTGLEYRDFITLSNDHRFRQAGTATSVKFFFQNEYGYATGVYLKVWRKVGSGFNLIATSENVLPSLGTTGAIYTVTFSQALSGIQEGDYYGYRLEADYGISAPIDRYFLAADPAGAGAGTRYVNQSAIGSSFAWETDPSVLSNANAVPMEFTMSNPDVVFIGDGIVAGHPANNSFLEVTALTSLQSTMSYAYGSLVGHITQNLGIGYLPQTTTEIAARFASDALALKPRVIVIEGGVNDVGVGGSLATYTGNITSMLAAAEADPVVQKVILLAILPWTMGSNGNHATIDLWNAELQNIAGNYSKAQYVDASVLVGQHRVGGATGNLWDIIPAYTPDGIHYNATGASIIAHVLQIAMCSQIDPVWTYPANNATIHTGTVVATGTAASGDLVTITDLMDTIIGTGIANGSGVWSILITGMDVGSSDAFASNIFRYRATDPYSAANILVSYNEHTLIGKGVIVVPMTGSNGGTIGFAGGGMGTSIATITTISTSTPTPLSPTPVVSPSPSSTFGQYPLPPSTTTELEDVYAWGKSHAIVTDTTFDKTAFLADLTRLELARLMVAYVKNIAGDTITYDPACDISTYSDYADIPTDMRQVVRDACSLGIMGRQNDKQHLLPAFRPKKIVTRAQLSAVLARYMYGNEQIGDMSTAWYTPYMTVLHSAGVMNRIDQPDMIERRGYVVTMLQRIAE